MNPSSEVSMPEPEFSRSIEADSLQHGTSQKSFTATKEECNALKERLGIDELQHLSAQLDIKRTGSGGRMKVRIAGKLKANIAQICVVALESFNTTIKTEFETTFDARSFEEEQDLDVDLQVDDPSEPIIDGIIDLGELIAQSLALEIDLHPRKPGVESDFSIIEKANHSADKEGMDSEHPFAALQNLKIEPKD